MTVGPITITPDEKTAAALETVARQSDTTPAEVALQIITEHFEKYPPFEVPQPEKATYDTERMAKAMAKIEAGEKLNWDDLAGIFHSGVSDSAERLEEILEEEWLIDEN